MSTTWDTTLQENFCLSVSPVYPNSVTLLLISIKQELQTNTLPDAARTPQRKNAVKMKKICHKG